MEQVKIRHRPAQGGSWARHGGSTRKDEVPLEVADLKSLFEEREASFWRRSRRFETLKQQRRAKEREIEEERDKVERAKRRETMSIKTNREYYAMLKEIEGTRRTNVAREEELLSLLARYEDAEKRLAERRPTSTGCRGRYRERMVDIDARMGTFDDDIGKLGARRQAPWLTNKLGSVPRAPLRG